MSEEEKKAIDHIKNYPINWLIENVNESAIKIVLNLIKKQQKEIEELKEKNNQLSNYLNDSYYVSADKIREKIKNIEDIYKKEMKPYQTEYGLNVSLLSKKEKEELINKRNGLLTQKITLEQLLEEK